MVITACLETVSATRPKERRRVERQLEQQSKYHLEHFHMLRVRRSGKMRICIVDKSYNASLQLALDSSIFGPPLLSNFPTKNASVP